MWVNGNCFHLSDADENVIDSADWHCPAQQRFLLTQESRQFEWDSWVSRRFVRSTMATLIMASEQWGWVS